ncbi:hypothetical protein WA1_06475 [Scytonema hofmannii PCC 7110]|uniref:Uncharacterized protein n=1 Tax=Scytonema hofmannii PCC 7110 TaxID=128403 RepID=A0A139WST4_9CYAN|nr:hypothetical protein WA1_06475 [Scytonema hofmannii PCC 7110]
MGKSKRVVTLVVYLLLRYGGNCTDQFKVLVGAQGLAPLRLFHQMSILLEKYKKSIIPSCGMGVKARPYLKGFIKSDFL